MNHVFNKKNIKYSVNPLEKKVVCWIENTQYAFVDFVRENSRLNPLWYTDEHKLDNKLKMPNKFVGVATCGPDDVWDEETGKLIAYDRMKKNLCRSFFKRANTYVHETDRYLQEICDKLNAYGDKLESNQEHREALIESILGEKEEQ